MQRDGFAATLEAAGRSCLDRIFETGDADFITGQIHEWLEAFPKPIAIMTQMDYLARFTADAPRGSKIARRSGMSPTS